MPPRVAPTRIVSGRQTTDAYNTRKAQVYSLQLCNSIAAHVVDATLAQTARGQSAAHVPDFLRMVKYFGKIDDGSRPTKRRRCWDDAAPAPVLAGGAAPAADGDAAPALVLAEVAAPADDGDAMNLDAEINDATPAPMLAEVAAPAADDDAAPALVLAEVAAPADDGGAMDVDAEQTKGPPKTSASEGGSMSDDGGTGRRRSRHRRPMQPEPHANLKAFASELREGGYRTLAPVFRDLRGNAMSASSTGHIHHPRNLARDRPKAPPICPPQEDVEAQGAAAVTLASEGVA